MSERDYEAIETAVLETARGRWFLGEFARRNRAADTAVLLDAVRRLEGRVAADRQIRDSERLRFDLIEMAKAVALSKDEVAALQPADHRRRGFGVASDALDEVTRMAERATCAIVDAAERMQEAAWTLREGSADPALCDELDRHATAIYTACSVQDLTARQTAHIIQTLRSLESRIESMIEIWGGAPVAPPPLPTSVPSSSFEPNRGSDPGPSTIETLVIDDQLLAGRGADGSPESELVEPHEKPEPST